MTSEAEYDVSITVQVGFKDASDIAYLAALLNYDDMDMYEDELIDKFNYWIDLVEDYTESPLVILEKIAEHVTRKVAFYAK